MPWSTLLHPTLTTVAQPAYDLGVESARLLLSRLGGYSGAARMVTLSTIIAGKRQLGAETAHRRPAGLN